MSERVITRFAPSPTGHFHVGGIRSALYNFLFARQNNGLYILRSEDTDRERSKKEYEDEFLEIFEWLRLKHDLFFRQSERKEIYQKYVQQLLDNGFAYLSHEEVKEIGQRNEVIRFKNPNKKVTFKDLILGEITVDTTDLGNFVIAKSVDEPIYHLAVVIDDFEMGVTHVIRGQEHAANTPRQILIQEAIGAPRPFYAHLPLILNKERAKLSKRDESVPPAIEYKKMGYMPGAILNFMALNGWNPGDEQEVFSLEELIEKFNLSKVQKGGGVFNPQKLEWLNREHIKLLPEESRNQEIHNWLLKNPASANWADKIRDKDFMSKIYPIIFDHISKWKDIDEIIDRGELSYFFEKPSLEKEKICWKKQDKKSAKNSLEKVLEILEKKGESISEIMELAEKEGKGEILWPLRYCLSGKEKSPDPLTLVNILGKNESIERLKKAIELLAS